MTILGPALDGQPTPDNLPLLPLKGNVVFPAAVVPLAVAQERSMRLVEEVMRGNRLMAVVAQKNEEASLRALKTSMRSAPS